MPLTMNEHYAASAGYFMGGILSSVTNLWLIFDFLPSLRINKIIRILHQHVALANTLVVIGFAFGGVSHFEQAWIFGPMMCKFYTFLSKFSCILCVGALSACLYGEYQYCCKPVKSKSYITYIVPLLICWANALFWGYGAITWAKYGQEPAGFTCTVLWYKVQPYMTYMPAVGFGIPMAMNIVLSLRIWMSGNMGKSPTALTSILLSFTMLLQYSGFTTAYMFVVFGYTIPLYVMAFIPIWTKVAGILHPIVYSNFVPVQSAKEE